MRAAIAAEAARRSGRPDDVERLRRLVERSEAPLFPLLLREGLTAEAIVVGASVVTGLPPAPRLLLQHPQIPGSVDGRGIRGAGGVPIGSVQGRQWIAFPDPEWARAAVFSDDVVVCLAVDDDLALARALFDELDDEGRSTDTVAMNAISPEEIDAMVQARKASHTPTPTPTSTSTTTTTTTATTATTATTTTTTGHNDTTNQADASHAGVRGADDAIRDDDDGGGGDGDGDGDDGGDLRPERLRMLQAAQLGRLRRFRFRQRLGHGAMGAVFLVEDTQAGGPPRALKVLHPHLLDDPLAVARFRREVQRLASLRHAHIIPLLDGDATEGGDVLWLLTPFLDGGTLGGLGHRAGPMAASAVIPILHALARALAAAHGQGVVHRDLKPENILLNLDGGVRVADFGVARAIGDAPLTAAGVRTGTPAYMAPEQARGDVVDHRADLFSLGVIGTELLLGHNPFARATPPETAAALLAARPRLPEPDGLHQRLATLLQALMAVAPDARPASADLVVAALEPAARTLPPVDAIIARLLDDPHAFPLPAHGAPHARPADDDHSAFGDVLGQPVTMELRQLDVPVDAGAEARIPIGQPGSGSFDDDLAATIADPDHTELADRTDPGASRAARAAALLAPSAAIVPNRFDAPQAVAAAPLVSAVSPFLEPTLEDHATIAAGASSGASSGASASGTDLQPPLDDDELAALRPPRRGLAIAAAVILSLALVASAYLAARLLQDDPAPVVPGASAQP